MESSKCFWKNKKEKATEQLLYWPEKIIYNALVDSDISHDEVTRVINEEENYFYAEWKHWAKVNQLDDIEWDRLVEHSKKIGWNER